MPELLEKLDNVIHNTVDTWDDNKGEKCGEHQAPNDRYGEWAKERGLALGEESQWKQTENRGDGRQDDRAETESAGGHDGFVARDTAAVEVCGDCCAVDAVLAGELVDRRTCSAGSDEVVDVGGEEASRVG